MSALIFVAVAVAWAVYLVPKALEHHDESLRDRTVSTFSHTMRVLARREPVSRRATRLVAGAPAPAAPAAAAAAPAPVARTKRRRSAAARRRTVLIVLVLANVGVAIAAGLHVIGWVWLAAPAGLLVAWLVACRLMVRRERDARRRSAHAVPAGREDGVVAERAVVAEDVPEGADADVVAGAVLDDDTTDLPAVTGRWDPVDVPLPTYVSKPPAVRRTVRAIDLDATGVWSSGRNEVDSALAREADAARRDAREEQVERRAAGS